MLEAKQKRRDQISIAASILENSRECTLKTQIMCRANLSFNQLNSYLTFLIEKGLIAHSLVDGKECYVVTQKGLGFIRKHQELTEMLQANSNTRKAQLTQQSLF